MPRISSQPRARQENPPLHFFLRPFRRSSVSEKQRLASMAPSPSHLAKATILRRPSPPTEERERRRHLFVRHSPPFASSSGRRSSYSAFPPFPSLPRTRSTPGLALLRPPRSRRRAEEEEGEWHKWRAGREVAGAGDGGKARPVRLRVRKVRPMRWGGRPARFRDQRAVKAILEGAHLAVQLARHSVRSCPCLYDERPARTFRR